MAGIGVLALLLVIIVVVIVVKLVGGFSGDTGADTKVPDVTGMAEVDAQTALQRASLAPKTVQQDYNDKVPAGSVFNQNPAPGRKVRQGSVVSLYISLGQGRFTVPNLAGQDVTAATRTLIDAGFKVGEIQKSYRADLPAGQVINQDPAPGRVFETETSINLLVADVEGLPAISMPAVTGLPLNSAEAQLATSLRLSLVEYVPTDDSPAGVVLSQKPAAAESVEMGSLVQLTVAMPLSAAAERNKTVNLHIPIPSGPDKQRVRVKVFDGLGSDVYFDEELSPGGVVDKRVNIEGKATILIFMNDMEQAYRKEIIPYTGAEPAASPGPAGGAAAAPPAGNASAPEPGGY